MFDSLIVLIRESAEALFIISAVCVELYKAGKGRHLSMVAYGVAAGGMASLALSLAWPGRGLSSEESALLTIFASLAIGFIVTEAVSSTASIRRRMSRALDIWLDSAALPAIVFVFSALIIFRESMEAFFFLRLATSRSGAAETWVGALLGVLVMACAIGLWMLRKWMRRGLQIAFQLSSCLLVVMTVQALLTGLENLFRGYGAGHSDATWATTIAQLLSNQAWHIWLLAGLALVPLIQLVSKWRKEISILH
jgi:FTR1 family protein